MNEQNSTKRTAEVSQIASLVRAKAQKHPEVIDIVAVSYTHLHGIHVLLCFLASQYKKIERHFLQFA